MTASDETHRAIDAVWRIESARMIAGLARIVRDVGVAEELAQDALVAALEQWPESGVPTNPGAWLICLQRGLHGDRRCRLEIRRALAALERAEELGGARGPYTLQAALAACHARARTPEETDWAHIARLYAELAEVTPSPVVELNRAVAVAMAFGPAAGLELVDGLTSEPSLQG
jgi:predicted RNA polymerase sigma factor